MHATRETDQTVNLALFDFDGTLCTRDSFTHFIFYALSKRHIVRQGIKILPWIQAYYLKLYPAPSMRIKLFDSMFRDTPLPPIQQLAKEYAQQLMNHLDPKLYAQLKQHQLRGDKVVIVSASIDLYLKPLADLLDVELICTEVDIRNQIITGTYTTPDCSSEQKKQRVLRQYNLDHFELVYAYGNSHEDLDMMSLADASYMVGEDQTLPHIEQLKKFA